MPAESEPTSWELMRRLDQVIEQLARMETRMLTVDVFRAHNEGVDRRFATLETEQAKWQAESRSEHSRLDGRITNYRDKQDALERAQRESRGRVWLAIGISILGMLGSLGVGLLLRGAA